MLRKNSTVYSTTHTTFNHNTNVDHKKLHYLWDTKTMCSMINTACVLLYTYIRILYLPVSKIYGWVSSVGIATRYWPNGPGIEYRCGRDFSYPSRTALGPTQSPVLWVTCLLSGGKVTGVWRSTSMLYLAPRIKKEKRYTSSPPLGPKGLF